MALADTPDFAQPLSENGLDLFYPYQSGAFTLAPEGLGIATSESGKPAFSLELVQGAQSYGVLDMTLVAGFRMEDALKLVRLKRPGAAVQRAQFTGGLFRWVPRLESDMPPGFLDPKPIGWNGFGAHRFILKLSKDAAVLVRDALNNAAFILDATVDVEMEGVAPRVPVRVKFSSSEFLRELRREGLLLSQEDVIRRFTNDLAGMPIKVDGTLDPASHGLFAEALTDRVRARLGRFAAAPSDDPAPHFSIPAEGEFPPTEFNWDLSEPMVVRRGFTLRMSPLEIARDFIKHNGAASVWRSTLVPPLPTGQHSITLLFNLAQGRAVNVPAAGATLKAPPMPPHRFQAATAAAEVRPPAFATSARLRLSPVEKLAYQCTTWAAVAHTSGVLKYEAAPFQSTEDLLNLGPDELPVRIIPVAADESLLNLATIEGTITCANDQQTLTVTFRLDDQTPAGFVAIPRRASDCQVSITAREKAGSGVLTLPLSDGEAVQLGLYSFREYGPQTTTITLPVPVGQPSVVLEVLPDGEPESERQLVVFTSRDQTKPCSWFAKSPFHPGFRYRKRTTSSAPSAAWSEVRLPFEPLVFK